VEYKVRRLQQRDLIRVAKIVRGCAGPVRASMLDSVTVTDPETGKRGFGFDPVALGFAFFEAMVDQSTEINFLFADLVGMKPEKFEQEPFDAMVAILEQVMEQDDLPAFLSRVTGLTNKMSGGQSISSRLVTVGATTT
jgi:hypothetical protein